MRLTLVISTLSSGGAERVMSIMANFWVRRDWPVTLLTFDDGSEKPFFNLDPQIIRIPLNVMGLSGNPFQGVANNWKRLLALRTAVRKSEPDAVLSFMDTVNVLTLLATVGLKTPVIVAERTDPASHPIGKTWNLLRRWIYPLAAGLVVQSHDVLSFVSQRIRRRAHVIPNPAIAPPITTKADRPGGSKQIVAMGRLGEEKGFDLLLNAFARIASRYPDWSLIVWGEGEQRAKLEELRDKLGLHQKVRLPGRTREPLDKLREAAFFVLPSRYEGFPNAVCEAMACGLPVISFDCPSGPRNIIRNNVDGLLVRAGDIGALASAMEKLILDELERKRLSARAL
ncbi:MAG: glycosyltransferase family 4 protein, partial [Verrucomicrobia bacterium]